MKQKIITVAFYRARFSPDAWKYDLDRASTEKFLTLLAAELSTLGVELRQSWEDEMALDVRGYGDLLNTVRLRSPSDGFGNLCLGHVIGVSANRDLLEDIKRGINRLAFAPETVEPEGSNKIVCHNCGCGC